MVARTMCVMYYGRSCAQNGNEAEVAQKQHGNYHFAVRPVTVNLLYHISLHSIVMMTTQRRQGPLNEMGHMLQRHFDCCYYSYEI